MINEGTFRKKKGKGWKIPILQLYHRGVICRAKFSFGTNYEVDFTTNLLRIEMEIYNDDNIKMLVESAKSIIKIDVNTGGFTLVTDVFTIDCIYLPNYYRNYTVLSHKTIIVPPRSVLEPAAPMQVEYKTLYQKRLHSRKTTTIVTMDDGTIIRDFL
ncbi:MAG: hypothetical protein COA82_03480 [Alkaliphilus sp.]|nr:MAG: hypothetical protein COA82_03480 [Alkaliphilus sp.]